MCGIFGIIQKKPSFDAHAWAAKACDAMHHRGPDAGGLFSRDAITFAHRRLAILDISGGKQPMHSPHGRYSITYNGEIYNHQEVRKVLYRYGYNFSTTCDTETLLAAYEHWGEECVLHLRGMFAFAIADFEKKEVFLARDPFGIKPLVYRVHQDCFAFSSEIPSLSQHSPLHLPRILEEAIPLFFRYAYIPAPLTIYENICKLRPGHYMVVDFDANIKRIQEYYRFSFAEKPFQSYDAAVLQAGEILQESVLAHTLSDVPVGVLLSGGVDSTITALNLARHCNRQIPAFTVAFHEQECSELEYAKIAAEELGLSLHVTYLKSDSLAQLEDALDLFGEPFGDRSLLPLAAVSKLARESVTVVLSGDGGDELFGGYSFYSSFCQNLMSTVNCSTSSAFRDLTASAAFLQELAAAHGWFFTDSDLSELLTVPVPSRNNDDFPHSLKLREISGKHPLDIMQEADLALFLSDYVLTKADKSAMLHSLEVRPVFLDKQVAAFASSLPVEYRYNLEKKQGKTILKDLLRMQGFSEAFAYRKKMPFTIPVAKWFASGKEANVLLTSLLAEDRDSLENYISIQTVQRMLATLPCTSLNGHRLWLVLVFALWLRGQHRSLAR